MGVACAKICFMDTYSLSLGLRLSLSLRLQRSQSRNEQLLCSVERARTGLSCVSTERLGLLKQQYIKVVATELCAQEKRDLSSFGNEQILQSTLPLTTFLSEPSCHDSHDSPLPYELNGHHSSEYSSSSSNAHQLLSLDFPTPRNSHASLFQAYAAQSSTSFLNIPSNHHFPPAHSPSNRHSLSSHTLSDCHSPLSHTQSKQHSSPSQTPSHTPTSCHSPLSHTPSSCHSSSSQTQRNSNLILSPSRFSSSISSPQYTTAAINEVNTLKHSVANGSSTTGGSSHLLSLLGEECSSNPVSSSTCAPASPPSPVNTQTPVVKATEYLSKGFMQASDDGQYYVCQSKGRENMTAIDRPFAHLGVGIKLPQTLSSSCIEDNNVMAENIEFVERMKSPVDIDEKNKEEPEDGIREAVKKETTGHSVTLSPINSSSSEFSDDFWASTTCGPTNDLPLPEDVDKEREKETAKEEEHKKNKAENTASCDVGCGVPTAHDHSRIIQCMLRSLNDRLQQDRDEARYLYMDHSPTDSMTGLIVRSEVLAAVLTRISANGRGTSSWDSRAVATVLKDELRQMVMIEGPLILENNSRQTLEKFSDGLTKPWKEVWSLLVEHARLVFQCGQPLSSVASVFNVVEEEGTKGVLLNLLEASCGVEKSLITHDDHEDNTISSSFSSFSKGEDKKDVKEPEADVIDLNAYQSLLLQSSSLVLRGDISSDEADTDIEQEINNLSSSMLLPSLHHSPAHTSDAVNTLTVMKRMGLLEISGSDSDSELLYGNTENKNADDFDFYS